MRLQLLADDLEVPFGVAVGEVDDVAEHPGPLRVAQERVAQPGARAGAFDEAGQVGDRRLSMVVRIARLEVQDAEVRARAS